MNNRVESIDGVIARACGGAGGSRTKTLNRWREGLLPPPVKNGRINLWVSDELDILDQAIILEKTENEVREIVYFIVEERTSTDFNGHPQLAELRAMVRAAKARVDAA